MLFADHAPPVVSGPVGPITVPNSVPVASSVTISGSPIVGQLLTGSYTYSDVDGDAQGASTYRWLRNGVAISGATATSYTLVAADEGALITFEVTPVAATGASPGAPVQSAAVGPVGPSPANALPVATNVTITGSAQVGQVLTGTYTYNDAEGDLEGGSTYRWLRGATQVGTGTSYTLVAADAGTQIVFEVTPEAQTGNTPGVPVQSSAIGPVLPAVAVSGIAPNTVASGSSVAATITGVGFAPGATLTFESGSGPAPQESNVVVVDANTITATITARSGGPPRNRQWTVRVTNLNGSTGVLAGGLTVTP